MIDIYSSACKMNVIIIIMLKIKVLCATIPELPAAPARIPSNEGYTEYFNEHNVGINDAKNAFQLHAHDLLKKNLPAWCKKVPCNRSYCLGNAIIHDHCCCDSRHGKEQFPWLPHSCYVGETCKANIGSCILYTEIRECCCDRAIAQKWEAVLSTSTRLTVQLFTILISLFPLFVRL